MRDKNIIAEHQGGLLSLENHQKLMEWAMFCVERIIPYYETELDETLICAIKTAKAWQEEKCSTGDAIKASRKVHNFAKGVKNSVDQMIIRSIGQGVATAHMADHSIGAALYAQKALTLLGLSYEKEKELQISKLQTLPNELSAFIIETMEIKAKGPGLK